MVYSCILVDAFYLYYKKQFNSLSDDPIDLANSIISYIEHDIMAHLNSKTGILYLLFDPIPLSDLGYSSCFKTMRQKKNKDYKSNREHDKRILKIMDLVRRYFLHKGPKIQIAIDKKLEADDYVEGIIKLQPADSKIALVTIDEDWSRYLSSNVVMINSSFAEPYTCDNFKEKYGFVPTIATVTFFKAIFGDPADNIDSIFLRKKLPDTNDIKRNFFKWIQFIGERGDSFEDAYDRIKHYTFMDLQKKKDSFNEEESLFYKLTCMSPKKDILGPFLNNVEVIKCLCDDVTKYIISKEPDPKFDRLILEVLGRNGTQVKKFKFGNIKAK